MRTFPQPLPIDIILDELSATLSKRTKLVVVAPPGAGKTTRIPLFLLDEPWMAGKKLIVLEPRRLAARAAADRMAQTLGEAVGETVGLRVRMGSKISRKTRIEVVTEGVFARMILDDPALDGIGAVLFDEFHERSLDADLGLAFALDAQSGLREDLRLIVMSATLDGARVAGLLGDAPVIQSEGRAFPIETRHVGRNPRNRIEDDIITVIRRALGEDSGSLLVFLPGQGEIRRVETLLRELVDNTRIDIAPLYGALDRRMQDLAVSPAGPGRRKIVLATSIAETSLTIEGVRVIIDSGLARVPVYEPDIGLTRLETVRVSRAAADQRRGRAGRTEPGICYRLWEEAATGALEPFARPEILSADLAPLLLDCIAWGIGDPTQLAFLDPPPAPALNEARILLKELGAIDETGRLTPLGKQLRTLALPPRLAAMVLRATSFGRAPDATSLAVMLVERGLGGDAIDLDDRLDRFRRDRSGRAEDARKLAMGWRQSTEKSAAKADTDNEALMESGLGALVALAYPDRIAKARGKPGDYLMANRRGAVIEPHERLAHIPYLAIAEISGKAAAARILAAAAINLTVIEALFKDDIVNEQETVFDRQSRTLRTRETRRYGALVLNERPIPVPLGEETAHALARGIVSVGIKSLPWSKALLQWRERIMFLRKAESDNSGGDWPDLSDEALTSSIEDWLTPYLSGLTSLGAIGADVVSEALHCLLPWSLQRRLETEAPTHFEAPTGSIIPIDYGSGEEPVLAIRVQELFGQDRHPSLAGGRVPLLLHLLSPAHRPIQITRDLPGFWRGSWADVKAEMRGRYPKHPWPDDPVAAPPTRRVKPRST